jgi:hypothetical protein
MDAIIFIASNASVPVRRKGASGLNEYMFRRIAAVSSFPSLNCWALPMAITSCSPRSVRGT